MKKRLMLLLPVVSLLFACGEQNNNQLYASSIKRAGSEESEEYGDDRYYALFMLNFPRSTSTSPNGYEEMVENTLYQKVEIVPGQLIPRPEKDPERNNYEFQGWYKEKICTNEWDFENDVAVGSTILYAKWGTGEEEEYVEPEYIPEERIITDMDYRVTGILNKSVYPANEEGLNYKVDLTAGGINRLIKHKEDVSFAVNYERRIDVTLTKATYDEEAMTIHLEVSSGKSFNILINDITSSLSIANVSTYYEQKASKYEQNGADIENYHIALGGSSSMENWSTSTEEMAPIVSFNHGIGGTTVQQWTDKLFERLILPYSPKAVAYYVGVNNIINSGEKGDETGRALIDLFDKTHEFLPNAKIFYVLINKLPMYGSFQPEFDIANNYALEYASTHEYLTCIDAGVGLLKENGLPHFGYFCTDGLHMSKIGYVIWGAAVKKAIMDWLG